LADLDLCPAVAAAESGRGGEMRLGGRFRVAPCVSWPLYSSVFYVTDENKWIRARL
jgi:hypothetical protein